VPKFSPQAGEVQPAGEEAKLNELGHGFGPPGHVLARKILIWVFVAIATGFSVGPIRNCLKGGSTKDYPLWYDTGTLLREGKSPYYKDGHGEFPFMYPPGAAGLLAMISPAGKLGMIAVLVTANSLAWFVCIVGPIYLLAGSIRGQEPLLYWVPSLCCIIFVWDTYLEGQVALFLSACLIGMFICLRHRVWWGAGALLALAAGVKGFPIFAIAYLIYRRYWKATAYTAGFLVLLLLVLPMFFRGPGGAIADLKTWSSGMGATYTPVTIGQRKERSYTWQNGSLISVTNRLLRPVVADHDDGRPPIYLNVASLSFRQVNIVIGFEMLCLCLIYLWVMPPAARRTTWSDSLEAGMLLILIILFSPLSFTYNNSWLMLPIASVLYFIVVLARTKRERATALVWLGVCLLLMAVGLPLGGLRLIRDAGNTFWADLVILAELGWLLLRHGRAQGEFAEPALRGAESSPLPN
jgi:energy-coupling factor transporter transmembrane protein EcfT